MLVGELPTLARIRGLRRAIIVLCILLTLWWILEFLNFAGRVSPDPFDVCGVAILAAGEWLVLQAWKARCPGCGNRFFVSSAMPLWFHLSSECPYCKQSVVELD